MSDSDSTTHPAWGRVFTALLWAWMILGFVFVLYLGELRNKRFDPAYTFFVVKAGEIPPHPADVALTNALYAFGVYIVVGMIVLCRRGWNILFLGLLLAWCGGCWIFAIGLSHF